MYAMSPKLIPQDFFHVCNVFEGRGIARIAQNDRAAIIDVPEVNYCNLWVRRSIWQSEQYFRKIPFPFLEAPFGPAALLGRPNLYTHTVC